MSFLDRFRPSTRHPLSSAHLGDTFAGQRQYPPFQLTRADTDHASSPQPLLNVQAAEAAAYLDDADRTGDQLADAISPAITWTTTNPLESDGARLAALRLYDHLQAHPELRDIPKWREDYQAIDDDGSDWDEPNRPATGDYDDLT